MNKNDRFLVTVKVWWWALWVHYIISSPYVWLKFLLSEKKSIKVKHNCCLVTKSCLTLATPWECSPPGSSVCGISQAEYWSGLPFPSSGDLPDPGIKPVSPALAGRFFHTTWKHKAQLTSHYQNPYARIKAA